MAEKTVSIRLVALVDSYKRAMGQAGQATADVAKKADNWSQLGRSMSDLGSTMTTRVTLPILAVGAAAVKMASDFDAAFVQMQTLAGVSAGEVDALKESVLDLAGETGKAPQELADALYFIQSAGLSGQIALDALEASAKGAAAGLGSTIQVADAVTNAINGYGAANITAAEATDVLIATAREGKAEASELAPQFGRLIPIAAELGISFDQLGGGMAYLTRASGDTSLAATQMSGVLAKLLEPGVEGAEALEQVGMSAESLRESVREKGLHQALLDLRDNLEANGLQLNDFSVDQQFLQGALQLTGASAEEAAEIFAALEDSAGSTDNAFATWADSMGADNARAFADFQVMLIRFGEVLAPIASNVLGFAADIASAFSDLPSGVQTAILGVAGLLAALGPLLSVGGNVVRVVGAISRTLGNTSAPAQAASGQLSLFGDTASTTSSRMSRFVGMAGRMAAIFGTLQVAGQLLDSAIQDTGPNVSELENKLARLADGTLSVDEAFGAMTAESGIVIGGIRDIADAINEVQSPSNLESALNGVEGAANILGGGAGSTSLENSREQLEAWDQALAQLAARDAPLAAAAFREISRALEEADVPTSDIRDSFDAYRAALAELDTQEAVDGTSELGDAMSETGEATEEATSAFQEYLDTLRAQIDPAFAMQDAMRGVRDAQSEIAAAEMELAAAREEHGAGSAEALAAEVALADARDNGARSAYDLHTAATELNQAIQEEGLSVQAAADQLVGWALNAGFTRDEALRMADALLVATARSDELGETDPTVDTEVAGYPETMARLGSLRARANAIPSNRTVHADVANYHETQVRLGSLRSAADRIPRNITISVGLSGASEAIRQAQIIAGYRAAGGPVAAGRLYEVAEHGKAELLEMGAHTYLIPGNDGRVVPADAMSGPMMSAAALAGGGGGSPVVYVSMAGAIVSSSYDAQRWASNAWNKAVRSGMVNIKPEAVRQ